VVVQNRWLESQYICGRALLLIMSAQCILWNRNFTYFSLLHAYSFSLAFYEYEDLSTYIRTYT